MDKKNENINLYNRVQDAVYNMAAASRAQAPVLGKGEDGVRV